MGKQGKVFISPIISETLTSHQICHLYNGVPQIMHKHGRPYNYVMCAHFEQYGPAFLIVSIHRRNQQYVEDLERHTKARKQGKKFIRKMKALKTLECY